MGFQLKLFGFVVVLLSTVSFSTAKNVTVEIIGSIHCKDCIRRDFSNSHASLGVDVLISCKSKNRGIKTQGNSGIDEDGKFSVTLSPDITEDTDSIEGCLAKLHTASSAAPCPIQSAQTASVKILSSKENATTHSRPTIIKFSPLTCQSAFFCPMPNFTNFPTPFPPVEYAPPPSEAFSPAEPSLSPANDLISPPAPASEPLYLPQVPSLPPTLPPPAPAPAPAPEFQSPQNPPNPTINSPSPPPLSIYNIPPPPLLPPQAPPLDKPILPPIPPKKHRKPHSKTPVTLPPTPVLSPPPPFLEIPSPSPSHPKQEIPTPPPLAIGISTPPSPRKPNFIPRAPPVPRLPQIPQIPRKYFNSPKSKSKPPHS